MHFPVPRLSFPKMIKQRLPQDMPLVCKLMLSFFHQEVKAVKSKMIQEEIQFALLPQSNIERAQKIPF